VQARRKSTRRKKVRRMTRKRKSLRRMRRRRKNPRKKSPSLLPQLRMRTSTLISSDDVNSPLSPIPHYHIRKE